MLTMVAIAAWQLAAGDASGALDTMVAKPDPEMRKPTALALLALRQRTAGDQAGYVRSVEQALEAIGTIDSAPKRASVFPRWAKL